MRNNPALRYSIAAVITLLLPSMALAQSAPSPANQQRKAVQSDYRKGLADLKNMPITPDLLTGTITADAYDKDIVLPPIGVRAVQLSNQFLYAAPAEISVDVDGWVTYQYGHGYPLVIVKPLQLSTIRLEKGEYILPGQRELVGDPRVQVIARSFGAGDQIQTYLTVKSSFAGESSDIVFGTNRRLYTIRVLSKPSDYTPRVAFVYPESDADNIAKDDEAKLQLASLQQQAIIETKKAEAALSALDTTRDIQNTDYKVKVKGKDASYMRPQKIWDDGLRTHVFFREHVAVGDLPIPKISSSKGLDSPNFRYHGNHLIIDAIFRKCELLSGTGHHQQKVIITNLGSDVGSKADHNAHL